MMTSFRFSCASKEQYSLYVKAFEVNPMNFTGRYFFSFSLFISGLVVIFFFNWRIIGLQSFFVFCQTSTWISQSLYIYPLPFESPQTSPFFFPFGKLPRLNLAYFLKKKTTHIHIENNSVLEPYNPPPLSLTDFFKEIYTHHFQFHYLLFSLQPSTSWFICMHYSTKMAFAKITNYHRVAKSKV